MCVFGYVYVYVYVYAYVLLQYNEYVCNYSTLFFEVQVVPKKTGTKPTSMG